MNAPAQGSRAKRKLSNWINGFLEYTEDRSSPKLFRKWAAITTIGACLERRVWCITAKGPTFPNLYVVLIGRPGIGKSESINAARSIVRATKVEGVFEPACVLAPVDVTKASLYDFLASKKVRRLGPDPEAEALGVREDFHYHSAFLAVSELGDLIRDHDTVLLNALHGLYDCLPSIEEERRYRVDNPIKIQRPQVSLLGGTTPAYISRTFPASAWDEGFMARTILIYSNEHIEPNLWDEGETLVDPLIARDLIEDLRQIGKLSGEMIFTDECKKTIKAWQRGGKQPAPTHIRLEHYCTRRLRHAIKLCMIASANRSNDMIIDVPDFQEALGWMIEAEEMMPQIFMEMVGKSDGQVMRELYHFVKSFYDSPLNRKEPVRKGLLVKHLSNKVQAWAIDKVIDACVDADFLDKVVIGNGETRYKPNPNAAMFKPGKLN